MQLRWQSEPDQGPGPTVAVLRQGREAGAGSGAPQDLTGLETRKFEKLVCSPDPAGIWGREHRVPCARSGEEFDAL